MKLILFNTNLAIKTVLSQIATKENYIIFTDLENIEKFFNYIHFNNIHIFKIKSKYGWKDLRALLQAKLWIKSFFKQNHIEQITYYHQAYGDFYNWIITYAHHLNIEIKYYRVLKNINYPKLHSLLGYSTWLKYKLLFNTDVIIQNRGNQTIFPKLSQSFLTRNNIEEYTFKEDIQAIKETSEKLRKQLSLNITPNSIILLTGSIIATNQVEINEYTNKTRNLIKKLGKENIICKCHPRFQDEIKDEKELQHIPNFIPMELLLDFFPTYIGYNSTILISAAQINKTAISLIDYYTPISIERKNKWYNYFSNANIKYIKDIQELSLLQH
ncbi:hypothetical protein [Phocaeicola coprocola]|uniref:hypothetical protein n=1 Tax=Phocaeicola coprocola TaxID=310298 RepID=UPI0026707F0D|nr:hypothetical protein [Phocaeicola coprocola]